VRVSTGFVCAKARIDSRILQPTSWPRARLGPWALRMVSRALAGSHSQAYSRMMREIMDVPFPRAASRRLISFLTFQISMFFSASLGCCSFDDMVAVGVRCGCVVVKREKAGLSQRFSCPARGK
jgi:hypothetical protein